MDRSDEELVALFIGETRRVCGIDVKPTWTRVVRRQMPQYDIGHVGWLERIDAVLSGLPGLHVAG